VSPTRRDFAKTVALAGISLAAPGSQAGSEERSILPRAESRGPVRIDACGGPGDFTTDAGKPLSDRAVRDARASGVSCVSVTVGPVGNRPELEAFEGIFRDLAYWEREIEAHPDTFLRVRKAADLVSERVGLLFALQDGVAFSSDLSRLEILLRFGVRVIQPTYNNRNLLGDGCLEPADAGLSRRGREAVERMNALGILVDLSHCGRRTTADAIALSSRPVAFTHTGCAAVHDHPRNKTDEQLKALADKGGVAGIYFMPYLRPKGTATVEDVLRHLEHALEVAGEDHVGIGTDGTLSAVELTPEYLAYFKEATEARKRSGIGAPGEDPEAYLFAEGLNTPGRFETLSGLLAVRGHTPSRIEKVLGGNFARLFAEAWS
jgi:membrane dipeptidase